jgi:hypothetical protein
MARITRAMDSAFLVQVLAFSRLLKVP